VGIRPIRRRLRRLAWPTNPASSSLCLLCLSLKNIYHLCGVAVRSPHSAFSAAAISPHAPPPCVVHFSLLPIARTHQHLLLLAPAVPPARPHTRTARSHAVGRAAPPLLVLMVPSCASGRSRAEPRAPMSAARAGGARSLRPKSTGPDLPSHMLQIYVSSVSDVSEVRCWYFVWMLQK
jgi:hypothetical protein